jgi:hypothetical protein
MQDSKQNHRVHTTGNGYQNRLALPKKPPIPNSPLDLLSQITHANRVPDHLAGASRQAVPIHEGVGGDVRSLWSPQLQRNF